MSDELLRLIRDAFPADPPPARPITGHRCEECDETDRLLSGRTWTDVADDFPAYCHDTYPLLTPAAKAYYLPAYLSYDLRELGSSAGAAVCGYLQAGHLDPAAFTPAQRAAVWAWVEADYRDGRHSYPPDSIAEGWMPLDDPASGELDPPPRDG